MRYVFIVPLVRRQLRPPIVWQVKRRATNEQLLLTHYLPPCRQAPGAPAWVNNADTGSICLLLCNPRKESKHVQHIENCLSRISPGTADVLCSFAGIGCGDAPSQRERAGPGCRHRGIRTGKLRYLLCADRRYWEGHRTSNPPILGLLITFLTSSSPSTFGCRSVGGTGVDIPCRMNVAVVWSTILILLQLCGLHYSYRFILFDTCQSDLMHRVSHLLFPSLFEKHSQFSPKMWWSGPSRTGADVPTALKPLVTMARTSPAP